MGVDYSGHYGIGIGVESIDFNDENLSSEVTELGCMGEFLDEKLDGEKYGWFEVGEGNYTGEENDFFVEIIEPFAEGLNNLEQKRDELLNHLKEIGVTPKGEFGAIGGLEVW